MEWWDSNSLAVVFACGPVAVCAWLAQSRLVFLAGVFGAFAALWLVPQVLICDYVPTRLLLTIAFAKIAMEMTVPVGLASALVAWGVLGICRWRQASTEECGECSRKSSKDDLNTD